jgi:hypothetical protein
MLLSASWWVVASASSHSLLLLLLYAKTVKLRCMLCLWWLLEPPGSVITGLGMHEIRSIACRWIGATTELCHFPAYMRSANVQGLMASKAKQVGMGWSDRSGAEEDKDGRMDGWIMDRRRRPTPTGSQTQLLLQPQEASTVAYLAVAALRTQHVCLVCSCSSPSASACCCHPSHTLVHAIAVSYLPLWTGQQ